MSYITDLTHYLTDDGYPVSGPPSSVGRFFGKIAAAASVHPQGVVVLSALRCRRRPNHKPCPGHLYIVHRDDGVIEWGCSCCEDNGFIHNWKGTYWDRGAFSVSASEPDILRLVVTEQEFSELTKIPMLSPENEAVFDRAVLNEEGIMMEATTEDFEDFLGYVAAEANHERNRRRRTTLEQVCGKVEVLLSSQPPMQGRDSKVPPMNPTINLIMNRVSMRQYDDRPIADSDVDAIIEAARRAPTAGNLMLYSMLIVRDQATKQALSESCDHQPFIARAPLVIVFLADLQRWFDYFEQAGVREFCRERGIEFTGPDEGLFLLACNDAIIAAQTSVIAAESLGICSCYIGDIMERIEYHRELLNLPRWTFPVAMVCYGYYPPGERPAPRSRFDREYTVFSEKYRRLSPAELESMFADWNRRLVPGNTYGAANAGQLVYARKFCAGFAREMARSIRVAMADWRAGPDLTPEPDPTPAPGSSPPPPVAPGCGAQDD